MNNPNFEKALAQTLKNEGVIGEKTGYVNSKNDRGGETNYGITIAKARECGYKGKMCDIPFNKVKEIYYKEYWEKTNAHNIENFNISFFLFDFAVNAGVKTACKKLQTAINKVSGGSLVIDGIIGEKTINAIEKYTNNEYYNFYINQLEKIYISEILNYYTNLSKFNIFGKGWIKRVVSNIKFLVGL